MIRILIVICGIIMNLVYGSIGMKAFLQIMGTLVGWNMTTTAGI